MIRAVSHASHYHFGNLSRAPFYQVVDAERVDHFAGSFVPFVPFFLHNLKPPIISCSELVVSCLANLGGEWLWGQLWTWRQWPSDSFWGRRANSLRSTTQTQVAFWGFQDSIPTSGLRRHIRVSRSRRFWELLSLGSICPRRPHLQMYISFVSFFNNTPSDVYLFLINFALKRICTTLTTGLMWRRTEDSILNTLFFFSRRGILPIFWQFCWLTGCQVLVGWLTAG